MSAVCCYLTILTTTCIANVLITYIATIEANTANINKGVEGMTSAKLNPAKRNVLDLKNETCKNREKRNVLKKIAHTTL